MAMAPAVKRAALGKVPYDRNLPPAMKRVIREGTPANKDPVDPQGTDIKAKKTKK
jgi:hypothetical protein